MHVEFIGAAGAVTGSRHLVHTPNAKILLDCGLFQGRREESNALNQDLGVKPSDIDVMVLSHAHIDHSGALPRLYKVGYRGPIYATPATRDLCATMLEDSAAIQQQDAAYINRKIKDDNAPLDPVEPLYDADDVVGTLSQMVGVPYRHREPIAPGVTVTFYDAGHVLGSAMVALDIDDHGHSKRLLFSGDLGRRNMPILRDPEIPPNAEFLIMESTYGDRFHDPIEAMDDALADAINKTVKRGGKVIIPSFALERAQEIIYSLKKLRMKGRIGEVPVYVDSPLTLKVTDVFRIHPECFDKQTRKHLLHGDSPFDFEGLRYVSSVEDSKAIDRSDEPCIVISASGMCEFGRVVHHLAAAIESKKNTVMIVGFQAQHTLGRRLVEQRQRVKIFGVQRERRAEVVILNGFSAHGDQSDLIAYAEAVREKGPLRQIALVHGEDGPRNILKSKLMDAGFPTVHTPYPKDTIRF